MWRTGPPPASFEPPPGFATIPFPRSFRNACPPACAPLVPAPVRPQSLRLPELKMIRPTDEGHFVRDASEAPNEIRDHQPPLGVEPHEDPASMNEKRHLVRIRRKRILRSNLPFRSFEKIRTADADRRKHKVLKAIELLDVVLRQHGTESRRHGNPALGVDPVGRVRKEAAHYTKHPFPRGSGPKDARNSRYQAQLRKPDEQKPLRRFRRGRRLCFAMNGQMIALVQCAFGIAWDHMGVNGMHPFCNGRMIKNL